MGLFGPRHVVHLRVTGPDGTVETLRFFQAVHRIGRGSWNDLVLDDPSVSADHARITVTPRPQEPPAIFIEDLKSDGGTFVGGQAIPSRFLVREALPIRIGVYTIEIHRREPPSADEDRFLGMLEASPSDDAARRVYGDWLEEDGQHDKAEMLRAELSLTELEPESPRFQELSARIEALAKELPLEWRRIVARPPIERCPVRFELVCPKRWDALAPTKSPSERHCSSCDRNVHYAPTVFEAQRLALLGHCIAVDLTERRSPGDLEPRPAPTAGMPVPMR